MTDTIKEIFLDIMNFRGCKRTLKWEMAYWGSTILNWYDEGLPIEKDLPIDLTTGDTVFAEAVPFSLTQTRGGERKHDFNVRQYFKLDGGFYSFPYLYWIYPSFEEKIVYEDEKYIEMYTSDGIRTRELKDHSSMPMWLEFPLKSRKDWEKIKEERFSTGSLKDRYLISKTKYMENKKYGELPSGIFDFPMGFFGSLRFLIGEDRLFLLYYDDPGLIHEICSHLCDLWLSIAEEITAGIHFDYACFWEDMAGKQGSLISPSIFREFMTPYYRKIIEFLKTRGINLFIADTDGKVDELIPLFQEAGVNILLPFERQAGNQLRRYRKEYPGLGMMGGIDKNILYKGRNFIDRELEDISWLIGQGGYIPHIDHSVPPNSTWENFIYYRKKLNRIIDSTRISG